MVQRVMYHLLSQDLYQKKLQHLDIIGVNSLSTEELKLLGIKYNFDITDVSSENVQVLDFYEVLDERSRDQNLKTQGLRSDFINKFRALGSWDPHLPEPTLHAEVKLCLNVLHRQREKVLLPRTVIGVINRRVSYVKHFSRYSMRQRRPRRCSPCRLVI